ncbi:AAA family ATPase, partial [Planktomarina temperata]|nr:AAA family ATPase [Planktomarina temperata]
MRLRRLDLIRYGHFTDFTIDFGARRETDIDLHIIYGPNEAGKSTSFEGFLDLLFGIPNRSKYNFLHDYENMRIGGALDIVGEAVELIRIKKSKNDLINPAGETVPSGILASGLRGIDRDQYRAMFSLDDDTIEAGGDDILASQGDLGELLFSAAAGLTDLGSVLEDARLEIDAFSKKRARKTELAELKRNLKDINDEIRSVDIPASTYRNLKERTDSASKLLTSSKMQRDELISQKLKIQTIIDCLEPFDTLRKNHAELAEIKLYPTVQEAHLTIAENLRISLVNEQANLRNGENQKSIEEDKLKDTELDEAIIKEEEVLNFLLDVPKARARTALEDIPKRELELSSLIDEINDHLAGLDLTADNFDQINEIVLAELEALASEYRSEINQLNNSRKEMLMALEAFEDLQQANTVHDSSVVEPHPIELLLKEVDPNHLLISKDMNSKALDE